ncbi:MAG TPA: Ig-like domain-containing protein [Acidimicrobiales bacterium]|nr:Ig-like domain-containing protein [Acidimicrobiales bacterium]
MAFDPTTNEVVLFEEVYPSGSSTGESETWTWDGTDWTQESPAHSPSARFAVSLATDETTKDVVLFGGCCTSGAGYDDTWIWNGSDWVQQAPTTSPPARLAAALTEDPQTGDLILFGGVSAQTTYDDTWTWNGSNWSEQYPAESPPGGSTYSGGDNYMATDPPGTKVVLFDGMNDDTNLDDAWVWTDGSALPATTTQAMVTSDVWIKGSTVTYSASVKPSTGSGTPTGTVNFSTEGTNLCTATLSGGGGSCTSSAAPSGNDSIVAVYSGDDSFSSSSGSFTSPSTPASLQSCPERQQHKSLFRTARPHRGGTSRPRVREQS